MRRSPRRRSRARWVILAWAGLLLFCLGCQRVPLQQVRRVNLQALVREHPGAAQLGAIESCIAQLARDGISPSPSLAPPAGEQVGLGPAASRSAPSLFPQVSWFQEQWSQLAQDRLRSLQRELARRAEEQTRQYQEQLEGQERLALAQERARLQEQRRMQEREVVEQDQTRILNLQLASALFDFNQPKAVIPFTPQDTESRRQRGQELTELQDQVAVNLAKIKQGIARDLGAFRQRQAAERSQKSAEYRARLEVDATQQRQPVAHRLNEQVRERSQWLEQAFPRQVAGMAGSLQSPSLGPVRMSSSGSTKPGPHLSASVAKLRLLTAQLRSSLERETKATASWLAAEKGMKLKFVTSAPARQDATAQVRTWLQAYWAHSP